MYFHVPNATELVRERWMYQESFEFMSAQLEHMNARLNAYSNTEVGSSNYPKPTTGAQFEIDQQSRETLRKRKVSRGNVICHYFYFYLFLFVYACITTNSVHLYFNYFIGRFPIGYVNSKISEEPIEFKKHSYKKFPTNPSTNSKETGL